MTVSTDRVPTSARSRGVARRRGAVALGLAALLGATGLSAAVPASAAPAPARQVIGWGYGGFGQTNVPSGLSGVTAVAAGNQHSLALQGDGTVVAWGSDYSGQTEVPAGLTGVTAISAGDRHNLALKGDGTVVGWGNDGDGQIDVPADLTGVTAISAGQFHSLALKGGGTVVGWGYDGDGQIDVPAGLTGVVAISAGGNHSLALKGDGTVVGWGDDGSGQSDVPADLTGAIAISAGSYHSLALKSDGTVVGWGFDGFGQTDVPAGLTGVTAISAGQFHNLALKSDGTVVGWGYDGNGQTDPPAGLSGVTAIVAGGTHSLAIGRLVAPKQSQTVAFSSDPPTPGVVGGSYTPTANGGGSGNPVTFSIDATSTDGACTIGADALVSFAGAGSCVIDADQAGNDDYAAAGTVSQTVTVVPVPASQPPAFTSGDPAATGMVGTAYTASFTASGVPAPTFSLVGAPSFLSIDALTGQVSGTPVGVGTFRYAVKATNAVGSVTTKTYAVAVAPANWQPDVRGFTAPTAGSAQGFTVGVVKNTWTMYVTQPSKTKTPYTATLTLDRGSFTAVKALKLETGDTFSVNGSTITFKVFDYGDLDGLTFTTPTVANAITFTLSIAGKPATGSQVFTGTNRTPGSTASPVTYRRTPGQ